MAFIQVNQPSGTGFFVFPIDEENVTARIPHDFTRAYPLAPFERIVSPKTFASLKQRVGSGALAVVGLWPDEAVTKKWELIVGGETCLFMRKTGLVGAGTVIHSERNRTLSEALFGKGGAGTHELLILLAGVTSLSMPLDAFYGAIGRKSRAPFKGFTTLSTENIARIEEKYGSIFGFMEAAAAR